MCEMLGMSANVPTDICFSFAGLIKRGGATGPHKDGWGITFYEGKGCRTFKDPEASHQSPIAGFLKDYPIKSCAVVSHIRQANRGKVGLENTHPFTRELWGRNWTFAHNGQLSGYQGLATGTSIPVGQTDSEKAFCHLLHRIRERFPDGPPARQQTFWRFVARVADELRALGVFNMLLSDGHYLMAYCSNNLHWLTRRAPFGAAKLIDEDMEVDFGALTTPDDVVTVIATRPLTVGEPWAAMAPGQYVVFKLGEVYFRGP
ncbi:class II glutamine amidotransferase [Gallaecimonas kandeliae]|uniref:class II glutamine amidotransferase n=1 Tax=Gallaecimonas kandeliae TaxID=3029055 RepID=UPI0026496E42|nr:class II glutamine amidotransferase [Gallaecimonas kandeliae]WKE66904.1 class II glutamine amidotransferase [Gallaecimonas kandeliae]